MIEKKVDGEMKTTFIINRKRKKIVKKQERKDWR